MNMLDSVSFIDFEYASYNPRGFDIGNHFNEYAGMWYLRVRLEVLTNWTLGFGPDYSLYPKKDKQYAFFESYLKSEKGKFTFFPHLFFSLTSWFHVTFY